MNGTNMDGADASKKPDINRKPGIRRPTRRCVYIIVAVIVLCLIVCIVLAVTLSAKSKDDCPKGIHCNWRSMPHSEFLKDERCDALCTTRPCVRSAEYALSRIDPSKDPCEDFYEFACGTYEQQTMIFPEESEVAFTYQEMENDMLLNLKKIIDSVPEKVGKSSLALQLTKALYDDCMNTDHHRDVLTKDIWKKLFSEDRILPWPLLIENAKNDQQHLVKMMSTSLFFDTNPFFTMSPPRTETVNDKEYFIIRFRPAENLDSLQAIHEKASVDDEDSTLARYVFAVGKILTEIGIDMDELKTIQRRFFEVEKHFLELATEAKETNEKVYKTNEHLSYETRNHSCQDLDRTMGNVMWCKLAGKLRETYGLSQKSSIRIELPVLEDHFRAVNTVFNHFLDRDIMNYIGVKFIMKFLKYMPSPLREIYYREKDLFPNELTYWSLSSRWQQCVEIVSEYLPMPLEREYLKRKQNEEALAEVRYITKKMKETYLSLVGKMSWVKAGLGEKAAKDTVRELELLIAGIEEIYTKPDAAIDDLYGLGFVSSGDKRTSNPLIEDVLALAAFNRRIPFVTDVDHGFVFNRHRQFHVAQPYYALGKIAVTHPVLLFPMFLHGRPMYLEYATLGSYISQQIGVVLMTDFAFQEGNSSMEILTSTANCLREEAHLYKTGKVKFKMEKLDDDTREKYELFWTLGSHASFQAYMDYLKENGKEKGLPGLPFTNKQLFFISAAQIHCSKFTEKGYQSLPPSLVSSPRFRVNVPFAHLKEFSEAFRCPIGSSMNPKRKCCVLGNGKLSHDCK